MGPHSFIHCKSLTQALFNGKFVGNCKIRNVWVKLSCNVRGLRSYIYYKMFCFSHSNVFNSFAVSQKWNFVLSFVRSFVSAFVLSFVTKTSFYRFLARMWVNETCFDFFLLFRHLCPHITNYCVDHLKFPDTLPPLPCIRKARDMKDMLSRLPHSCKALMKRKNWYKLKIEIISEYLLVV